MSKKNFTKFKSEVKEVQPEIFGFSTNQKVEFNINGKKFEGTYFKFDSKVELEDRKKMLQEAYGVSVIK